MSAPSRAAGILGDVLGAIVLALCIPIAMVVIATPFVLCVRLLLWVVGAL